MKRFSLPLILIVFVLLGIGVYKIFGDNTNNGLTLTSPAFKNNGSIPEKYTCKGEDINPPLSIGGIPKNTKSMVLTIIDQDAPGGNFVHWVLWNIGPNTTEIKENSTPESAVVGINGGGQKEYVGPCPPSGTHRYVFTLYALDTQGNDSEEMSAPSILPQGSHILDQSAISATFRRD